MSEHPIEVGFPSLARWRGGNTGIPYVWRMEGSKPGPHLCVTALVHGNEVCGAIALNALLNVLHGGVSIQRGTLTIVFANVDAYFSFDEKKPYQSRALDEDFNRLWSASTLDGERSSRELVRARELRAIYDNVDHLLDLHSMLEPAPPIALAGDTAKGLALARAVGWPVNILIDSGHVAGKRLRDYAGFGDPNSPKSALLIECGQHWERNVGGNACHAMWRFLRHFDALDRMWLDDVIGGEATEPQREIEVSQVVTMHTERFAWVRPLAGLEVIAKAGTVIAIDGEDEVKTPHDYAVMVMPVPNPKVGQTAVRIGRYR